MIPPDDVDFVVSKGETVMKKLMTLMLGLSIALGSVAVFAQNAPKDEKKMEKKKKASKKKAQKKEAEKK